MNNAIKLKKLLNEKIRKKGVLRFFIIFQGIFLILSILMRLQEIILPGNFKGFLLSISAFLYFLMSFFIVIISVIKNIYYFAKNFYFDAELTFYKSIKEVITHIARCLFNTLGYMALGSFSLLLFYCFHLIFDFKTIVELYLLLIKIIPVFKVENIFSVYIYFIFSFLSIYVMSFLCISAAKALFKTKGVVIPFGIILYILLGFGLGYLNRYTALISLGKVNIFMLEIKITETIVKLFFSIVFVVLTAWITRFNWERIHTKQ